MQKKGKDDAVPSIKKALSIHAFRHLWIGQLCSQLGANMLLSLLALRIYELTKSNTAVSALYITYGVPAVLFGMFAGVIVDHIDKRKILAFCNITRAFLIIPLLFFHENLLIVYTIMLLNSLISQFYLPAEAPLIPRLVPEKYLLSANSLFSFTFFASIAMGFVLAGQVLKYTGAIGSFIILISLYVTAIWSVTKIPHQHEDVAGILKIMKTNGLYVLRRFVRDLFRGIMFSISSPRIFDALLLLTGTQIVLAILGTLGPGFADQVLKIDVTDVSMLILGPAISGIIAGALWVGNYGSTISARRLTTAGLLSAGIFLTLISCIVWIEQIYALPRAFVFVLTIVLFFFLGISNSFLDVPSNATLQDETGGNMRGRIYGILTALAGGVGILPVVAGGILADIFGTSKVLFLLGIIVLGYGIIRLNTRIVK
jgi:MFS family permease